MWDLIWRAKCSAFLKACEHTGQTRSSLEVLRRRRAFPLLSGWEDSTIGGITKIQHKDFAIRAGLTAKERSKGYKPPGLCRHDDNGPKLGIHLHGDQQPRRPTGAGGNTGSDSSICTKRIPCWSVLNLELVGSGCNTLWVRKCGIYSAGLICVSDLFSVLLPFNCFTSEEK